MSSKTFVELNVEELIELIETVYSFFLVLFYTLFQEQRVAQCLLYRNANQYRHIDAFSYFRRVSKQVEDFDFRILTKEFKRLTSSIQREFMRGRRFFF